MYACGITEPGSDYIILTGGFGPLDAVAKYSVQGFVGNLPSLKIGRYCHGCGVFDNISGQKVYVVAGQALPRTLTYPASVSLADSVLLLGGRTGWSDYRREILSFNSSLAWTVVGTLLEGRSLAAAAFVTFNI